MGYPPPPPPPGTPGGYGPPPGAPGYGPPPGSPPPPPGGGYGGPPGGYAPTPPPSGSDSSKGPLILLMGAIVVVVLLAVVGGLILLTRDDGGDVELTEAQRTDALLTEGDIGGDFVEGTDDEDEGDDEPAGSEACLATLDELEAEGNSPFGDSDIPPGGVERHFEVDESGASVDHAIAPGIDIVSLYERFAADCDELSFTDDTGEASFTITERDAPDVGDEAFAVDIRVSAESEGATIEIDGVVVVWTRDGNDSVISYLAGLDPAAFEESGAFEPLPLDEGLLTDIVTTADDDLAEVIDGA